MTKPDKPSIAEQPQLFGDARASARAIISANLPAIANVLVSLAIQGNVSAITLCMKLGETHLPIATALRHALELAPDDMIKELELILADPE